MKTSTQKNTQAIKRYHKRGTDLYVNVIGDGNCFFRAIAVGHTQKIFGENNILQEDNFKTF